MEKNVQMHLRDSFLVISLSKLPKFKIWERKIEFHHQVMDKGRSAAFIRGELVEKGTYLKMKSATFQPGSK